MAVVQTRLFRSTQPYSLDPSALNAQDDGVLYEVNAFLATLDPRNVLAVDTRVVSVGKYGEWTHCYTTVTFLQ
jgi:hypothetical protein